jgi:hypothetical protein
MREKVETSSDGDTERIRTTTWRALRDCHEVVAEESTSRSGEKASRTTVQGICLSDSDRHPASGSETGAEAESETSIEVVQDKKIALSEIDPFNLPYLTHSERKKLPTCPGVYFAIDASGQVAYIGQSTNLRKRWRTHSLRNEFCESGDLESQPKIKIAWLEIERELLDEIETGLIRRFRPRLNTNHVPVEKPVRASLHLVYTVFSEGAISRKGMHTITEAAPIISVPPSTLGRWAASGVIPGAKFEETPRGPVWLIPQSALDSFGSWRPKRGRPRKPEKKGRKD